MSGERGHIPNGDIPMLAISDRELEVLKLFGNGLSNRQIGEKLSIAKGTVKTHKFNISKRVRRLGYDGGSVVVVAMLLAVKQGLLEIDDMLTSSEE